MFQIGYLTGVGISYDGRIQKITKSTDRLQPVYEAFTNAIEAIKTLDNNLSNGEIEIKILLNKNLFSENEEDLEFDSIVIEDNGVGFNLTEFSRFLNLDDTTKGIGNKGSGRVQYIHYFEKSEFESVYADETSSTGFRKRRFTLSKNSAFVKQNAIVRHDYEEETNENITYTILKLSLPLDKNDRNFFKGISVFEIKENIKNRYIALFCENRDNLPKILIQRLINNVIEHETTIEKDIIPQIDKKEDIEIHYLKINQDGKVEKSQNVEKLNLKGFKINKKDLPRNALKLTSKGEIASVMKLESIKGDDFIDDNRYLFLLSGELIDKADTDTRGCLNIPTTDDLKKSNGDPNTLFPEEVITLDEIKETANSSILRLYPEIKDHNKKKEIEIETLKEMFLLNPDTIKNAKIKPSDSEEEVLEKIYSADSKLEAKKDIEIKKRIEALNSLSPETQNYQNEFKNEVRELTKAIPLQNRTALTQYVARRKMVLDLFQKILDKEIIKLQNGGRIDEDLMHNLIFQQSSNKPEDSDLWLIAEEFIYFKGFSEHKLDQVEINGVKLFDKEFSEEENRYLNSLGEKRLTKRPDILLFPSEGKCIIIELKAPEVNVADHLNQIDFYANLIRNYTVDSIQITTFYGYLIGESIEDRDVRGRVSRFEHSYHFDYWYRPSENVNGFGNRTNGSIYTEVIKYTTLLERAKLRNKIFIDKL